MNDQRIRIANSKSIIHDRDYVLYWMQAYRRLASNHSLDYAIEKAKELNRPLVVYEGLRKDYPWNSKRIHKFILEGMCDNQLSAQKLGLTYWCYVETKDNPSQGILKAICQNACLVVTDDFPCFIIPEQIEKLAKKIDCQLVAIDGNGIIPLSSYGEFASAARILRTRIHKLFPEYYIHQARPKYSKQSVKSISGSFQSPFPEFSCNLDDIETTLDEIHFSNDVPPNPNIIGGRKQALKLLGNFLKTKLYNYGNSRSNPNPPDLVPSSQLSPYLHFGHISAEEVITSVLNFSLSEDRSEVWAPDLLNTDFRGKREGYYSNQDSINSYLDELITWRDTSFQLFWHKPEFRKNLNSLPNWAKENFAKHTHDKREYKYTKEEWMYGKTHDPIWNAAQNELRITGTMHNYMRMLWGKKIIEWSPDYESAFNLMEEFNNLFAYDGRNPNSYSGILWCFGLFDRPWYPERNVLGNVRYMSSESTKKKFKLGNYLEYIDSLIDNQRSLF